MDLSRWYSAFSGVYTKALCVSFFLFLFCLQGGAQNFYISGGNNFSTALCGNGKLLVWGKQGGLTPQPLSIKNASGGDVAIKQVDAGSGDFGVAVDCEGHVWAWDGGVGGTPQQVKGVGGAGLLSNIKYVNASSYCSYAILETGEVVAWGGNGSGELGTGNNVNSEFPVYVQTLSGNLKDAIQVEGADNGGYALIDPDKDGIGTVYSWGGAASGALGRDTGNNKIALPVTKPDGTPLDNIVSISGGDVHCLALDADGNVWAWGNNSWKGQSGVGSNMPTPYAMQVVGGETGSKNLNDVATIAAGQSYSIAVLKTGEVVAWGGITGDGSGDFLGNVTGSNYSPVYIKDATGSNITGIKSASDGDFWAFLIKDDGGILSIGYGPNGEHGLGDTEGYKVPQPLTLPDCDAPNPCPEANLGGNKSKCPQDVISLFAGSRSESFVYTWYVDGVKDDVASGKGASKAFYNATKFGKYKVEIENPTNNTCGLPCPKVFNEIEIKRIDPPYKPKATYCKGNVSISYEGMPEGNKYEWWTTEETATGVQLGSGLNPPFFALGTPPLLEKMGTNADGDIYKAYVEDKTIIKTKVGPSSGDLSSCLTTTQPNQTVQKITVLNDFTLDSLSFMYSGNDPNTANTGKLAIYSSNPLNASTPVVPLATYPFTVPAGNTLQEASIEVGHKFENLPKGGADYYIGFTDFNVNVGVYKSCAAARPAYVDVKTEGALVAISGGKFNANDMAANEYGITYNWGITAGTIYPCGRIAIDSIVMACPLCDQPASFTLNTSTDSICTFPATNSISLFVSDTVPSNPALFNDQPFYYYQWYKDGQILTGETTNAMEATTAAAHGTGIYKVRVAHKNLDREICYIEDSVKLQFDVPFGPNTVIGNDTICLGDQPKAIIGSEITEGTGVPLFQWVVYNPATGNGDLVSGTINEFIPASPSDAGTYYFKREISGNSCPTIWSDTAILVVDEKLDPGKINQDAKICKFAIPELGNNVAASGGRPGGTLKYFWESQADGATEWDSIPNTNSVDYANPAQATDVIYYRRSVVSGKCKASTVPVKIETIDGIDPGMIEKDSVFCFGVPVAEIKSLKEASGGTGAETSPPSSPTYEWYTSKDASAWNPIVPAVTSASYLPADFTGTVYFRRKAKNGEGACDTNNTNEIKYVRATEVTPGKIGPHPLSPICAKVLPETMINIDSARNGDPSDYSRFAFTWEWATEINPVFQAVRDNVAPGGLEYEPTKTVEGAETLTDTTIYLFRRKVVDAKCGPEVFSDTLKLLVYPITDPKISLENPGPICQLVTDTISFSEKKNLGLIPIYEWSYNHGAFNPSSISDSVYINTQEWTIPSTTIVVRVTPSAEVCTSGPATDTIVFFPVAKKNPEVSLAGITEICSVPGSPEGNFAFLPLGSPASSGNKYRFNISPAETYLEGDTIHSALPDGAMVTVVLESDSKCALTPFSEPYSVTVKVTPTPVATITDPGIICVGKDTILRALGGTEQSKYTWYKDGAIFKETRENTVTINQAGNYNVVIANGETCTGNSDTASLQVEDPKINIFPNERDILFGESVTVEAVRNELWPISWTPNEVRDSLLSIDSSGTTIVTSFRPSKTTQYTVTMVSPKGCKSNAVVNIRIFKPIHVPNAFSPNGDGRNDTWTIPGLETYPEVTVKVFNRWGNIVFESEGYLPADEWNGEKNGEIVPTGTYYYVIDPNHPNGGGIHTGNLTVVK